VRALLLQNFSLFTQLSKSTLATVRFKQNWDNKKARLGIRKIFFRASKSRDWPVGKVFLFFIFPDRIDTQVASQKLKV